MKGLIFTYLLTYGGAALSLFRPFHGLLIYVCFAIIRPAALWHWSVPEGNYSRIVAIGLLLGWALNGFGNWDFGKAKPVVVAFVAFWCWGLVSAFASVADSTPAFMQVEEYAKILLPFLVGMTTIRTPQQVKQLAWVVVLCQGYLAYEFNLVYYFAPHFNANEWTFGSLDRNGIAITMVTSAGMAFFLGLNCDRFWQRWLCFILAALMVHVVLFSLSRGGMLALIVTAVASFLLIEKRPKQLALFALAAIVGFSLAGPQVIERFRSSSTEAEEQKSSAGERLELWKTCASIMAENPITGIGLQNWKQVAHNYGFPRGKDAHTMWLHVGAEMGVVGLALLVSLYGFCVAGLWRVRRSRGPDDDRWTAGVAQMVMAALAGFAVSAQFVSVHGVELPYYICLIGAGTIKLRSLCQPVANVALEPIPVLTYQPRPWTRIPNSEI